MAGAWGKGEVEGGGEVVEEAGACWGEGEGEGSKAEEEKVRGKGWVNEAMEAGYWVGGGD